MELVGQVIVWIMMGFMALGAGAYLLRPDSPLAGEFRDGIFTIGQIFIPVAGMMGIIPLLVPAIDKTVGPIYEWLHSDPAIAVSTFLPSDQGAYALSLEVANSHAAWIQAFTVSLTSGAVIAFSIPVGLAMLDRKYHKYMALGTMCGLLAIPVTSLIMSLLLVQSGVLLREGIDTSGPGTKPFDLSVGEVLFNLAPLVIIMVTLALALKFFTDFMVKAFLVFGKAIVVVTTISMTANVIEYFTGVFSTVFGSFPLAPFIADAEDQFRALEVVGYIGVMLAGAFPMVYAIRTGLAKPLQAIGDRFGVSEAGITGFLAGATNILALFRVVPLMPPRDRVLTIAFSVCAAFAFGDYLAFTANFQPNMIVPMIVGKLCGGALAVAIAVWLAVPYLNRFEQDESDDPILADTATERAAVQNNVY
ncbi:ethanolamine utilization protein EutH [Mycobacterium sp. NS-7484]|uniref:ethanolamine utilization protein EutH n=1 Tax=Mycobacterium sp. NS-7484 TaxID=1834161 RepID=UPI00096E51C1|nr:ethanolamine utilization protein EutH [Mycobacterium sp. NS-7484]OMC05253.1 ethanolamine utilization protein EutH [Mycobacterium sp. NS-7484]